MNHIYRSASIRRITFAALIAALYFVLCLIEGPLASGYMANIRLAEGFCVFALFVPEVIVGASLGCFLYNFFFGFGIIDALIGTAATILGSAYIFLLGKFVKNTIARLCLFGLMPVLANAFLVPVVLILSLAPELDWKAYWLEFGLVASGEAIAIYAVGIPLYLATCRWLPKALLAYTSQNHPETKPNQN